MYLRNWSNRIVKITDPKRLKQWYVEYPENYWINCALATNTNSPADLIQTMTKNLEANIVDERERSTILRMILMNLHVQQDVVLDVLKNKRDSIIYWEEVAVRRITEAALSNLTLTQEEIGFYHSIYSSISPYFPGRPSVGGNLEYLQVQHFLKQNGFVKEKVQEEDHFYDDLISSLLSVHKQLFSQPSTPESLPTPRIGV